MTEAELDEFLKQNRETFVAAAKEGICKRLSETMNWQLPDVVHQQVAEFLKTEIAPEVKKMLADEKDGILLAARKASLQIGDALTKALVEEATKAMTGYRASTIFKALFNA